MHLVKEVNRSTFLTQFTISLPGQILFRSLTGPETTAITTPMVTTMTRVTRWLTMAQPATSPVTGEAIQISLEPK